MPTNLYGPNDNFDLETSHVLPALLRKTHEAKARGERTLTVWGSGRPRREFLHVDDMAGACVFLMEHDVGDGLYNVGTGSDVTIRELAETIMKVQCGGSGLVSSGGSGLVLMHRLIGNPVHGRVVTFHVTGDFPECVNTRPDPVACGARFAYRLQVLTTSVSIAS